MNWLVWLVVKKGKRAKITGSRAGDPSNLELHTDFLRHKWMNDKQQTIKIKKFCALPEH